jgi:carboxyl-terminal processing protease
MYFTPKGRTIHNKGITPDIVVEPPAKAPEPQPTELPKPQSEAEELKKDIQLQRAIEILKASQILGKNREKTRTEAQAR